MSKRTIWKYTLDSSEKSQTFVMPRRALFLSIQVQYNSNPVAYFEVDPTQEREERSFRFIGTGHAIPDSCKIFLGTILLKYGQTVLHLYEEDKKEAGCSVVEFKHLSENVLLLPTGTA